MFGFRVLGCGLYLYWAGGEGDDSWCCMRSTVAVVAVDGGADGGKCVGVGGDFVDAVGGGAVAVGVEIVMVGAVGIAVVEAEMVVAGGGGGAAVVALAEAVEVAVSLMLAVVWVVLVAVAGPGCMDGRNEGVDDSAVARGCCSRLVVVVGAAGRGRRHTEAGSFGIGVDRGRLTVDPCLYEKKKEGVRDNTWLSELNFNSYTV